MTAITGETAYQHFRAHYKLLNLLSSRTKAPVTELADKIDKLLDEQKELQKEIEQLRQENAGSIIEAAGQELTDQS